MTFFILLLGIGGDFLLAGIGFFCWKACGEENEEPPQQPATQAPFSVAKCIDGLQRWARSRKTGPMLFAAYTFMFVSLCMFVATIIVALNLASAAIYLE